MAVIFVPISVCNRSINCNHPVYYLGSVLEIVFKNKALNLRKRMYQEFEEI